VYGFRWRLVWLPDVPWRTDPAEVANLQTPTVALVEQQKETSKPSDPALWNALTSLKELSAWMRTHTGPADGTHEMLCRAVNTLKAAGVPLD
jgi:hypothetical protein